MLQQIANLTRSLVIGHTSRMFRTVSACTGFFRNDVRFPRPDTRITGDFSHEPLRSVIQENQRGQACLIGCSNDMVDAQKVAGTVASECWLDEVRFGESTHGDKVAGHRRMDILVRRIASQHRRSEKHRNSKILLLWTDRGCQDGPRVPCTWRKKTACFRMIW